MQNSVGVMTRIMLKKLISKSASTSASTAWGNQCMKTIRLFPFCKNYVISWTCTHQNVSKWSTLPGTHAQQGQDPNLRMETAMIAISIGPDVILRWQKWREWGKPWRWIWRCRRKSRSKMMEAMKMQMMKSFIGGITFGSGYRPGIGISLSRGHKPWVENLFSKMPVDEGISLVTAWASTVVWDPGRRFWSPTLTVAKLSRMVWTIILWGLLSPFNVWSRCLALSSIFFRKAGQCTAFGRGTRDLLMFAHSAGRLCFKSSYSWIRPARTSSIEVQR